MKKDFQQLNVIYIALLLGQIFFCIVTVLMIMGAIPMNKEVEALPSVLQSLAPAIVLLAVAAAWYLNRQKIAEGASMEGLSAKLAHYRSAVIMRCALVEGGNLVAIVLTLISGNFTYLLYFSMGLLAFLYFRPNITEFVQAYRLTGQEQRELEA